MDEPRPTTISARPRDRRSSVANSWNSRTGSAALSTVTALVSRMRSVSRGGRAQIMVGGGIEKLAAMVLADPKESSPAIRVLDLFDQIAETIGCADRAAVLGESRREAVDADFHG